MSKLTIEYNNDWQVKNEIQKILLNLKIVLSEFSWLLKSIETEKFLTKDLEKSHGIDLNFLYQEVKRINELWFKDIWFPKMEEYISKVEILKTNALSSKYRLLKTNVELPFKFSEFDQFATELLDSIRRDFKSFHDDLSSELKSEFSFQKFITNLSPFYDLFSFLKAIIVKSNGRRVTGSVNELIKKMQTKVNWMMENLNKQVVKIDKLIIKNARYLNWKIAESQKLNLNNWKTYYLKEVFKKIINVYELNHEQLRLKFATFYYQIKYYLREDFNNTGTVDFEAKIVEKIETMINQIEKVNQIFQDNFNNWKFNINYEHCTQNQLKLIDDYNKAIVMIFFKNEYIIELIKYKLQLAKSKKAWIISDYSFHWDGNNFNYPDNWDEPAFQKFLENTINEIRVLKNQFWKSRFFTGVSNESNFTQEFEIFTRKKYREWNNLRWTKSQFDICKWNQDINGVTETESWKNYFLPRFTSLIKNKYKSKINNYFLKFETFSTNMINNWNKRNLYLDRESVNEFFKVEIKQILDESHARNNYFINEWNKWENKVFISDECQNNTVKLSFINETRAKFFVILINNANNFKRIDKKIKYFSKNWKIVADSHYFHYDLGEDLESAIELGSNIDWFFSQFVNNQQLAAATIQENLGNNQLFNLETIEKWVKNEQILTICYQNQLTSQWERILKLERVFLNQKNQQNFDNWATKLFPKFLMPIARDYITKINQLSVLVNDCNNVFYNAISNLRITNEFLNKALLDIKIDLAIDKTIELIDTSSENWQNLTQSINLENCLKQQKEHILIAGSEIYKFLNFYNNEFKLIAAKMLELKTKLNFGDLGIRLSNELENEILNEIPSFLEIVNKTIDKVKTSFFESQFFTNVTLFQVDNYQDFLKNLTKKAQEKIDFSNLLIDLCKLPNNSEADNVLTSSLPIAHFETLPTTVMTESNQPIPENNKNENNISTGILDSSKIENVLTSSLPIAHFETLPTTVMTESNQPVPENNKNENNIVDTGIFDFSEEEEWFQQLQKKETDDDIGILDFSEEEEWFQQEQQSLYNETSDELHAKYVDFVMPKIDRFYQSNSTSKLLNHQSNSISLYLILSILTSVLFLFIIFFKCTNCCKKVKKIKTKKLPKKINKTLLGSESNDSTGNQVTGDLICSLQNLAEPEDTIKTERVPLFNLSINGAYSKNEDYFTAC